MDKSLINYSPISSIRIGTLPSRSLLEMKKPNRNKSKIFIKICQNFKIINLTEIILNIKGGMPMSKN